MMRMCRRPGGLTMVERQWLRMGPQKEPEGGGHSRAVAAHFPVRRSGLSCGVGHAGADGDG